MNSIFLDLLKSRESATVSSFLFFLGRGLPPGPSCSDCFVSSSLLLLALNMLLTVKAVMKINSSSIGYATCRYVSRPCALASDVQGRDDRVTGVVVVSEGSIIGRSDRRRLYASNPPVATVYERERKGEKARKVPLLHVAHIFELVMSCRVRQRVCWSDAFYAKVREVALNLQVPTSRPQLKGPCIEWGILPATY
jgi:hypothetical protein